MPKRNADRIIKVDCKAAEDLYARYGEAKANGTVAAWRAAIIDAYRTCKDLPLEECDNEEVGDLIDINADVNSELANLISRMDLNKRKKMVGGNPGEHLVKLLRWLGKQSASVGAASTATAYVMSDCAVWFLEKIFDGLKAVTKATAIGGSYALYALLDLAKAAAGNKETVTVQLLVSICDSMYNGGVTLASVATSAAAGLGSQPYVNVLQTYVRELLTTGKDGLKAMVPGEMSVDEFGNFIGRVTIGQVANAVGIVVSAIKWRGVAGYAISFTADVIYDLINASVGALAVAANSYLATGAFLAVSVVLNLKPRSKAWLNEHLQKFDEALAAYITTIVDVPSVENHRALMAAIAPLHDVPIARALMLQTLDNMLLKANLTDFEQGQEAEYIALLQGKITQLTTLRNRIAASKDANKVARSAVDAGFLAAAAKTSATPPQTADAPPTADDPPTAELTAEQPPETTDMIANVARDLFGNKLVGTNTYSSTAAGSSMVQDTFIPIDSKRIIANYEDPDYPPPNGKAPGYPPPNGKGGKRSTQKRRPKATLRKATLRKRASRNRKPYRTKRR
jgi:hypothetical protein